MEGFTKYVEDSNEQFRQKQIQNTKFDYKLA